VGHTYQSASSKPPLTPPQRPLHLPIPPKLLHRLDRQACQTLQFTQQRRGRLEELQVRVCRRVQENRASRLSGARRCNLQSRARCSHPWGAQTAHRHSRQSQPLVLKNRDGARRGDGELPYRDRHLAVWQLHDATVDHRQQRKSVSRKASRLLKTRREVLPRNARPDDLCWGRRLVK